MKSTAAYIITVGVLILICSGLLIGQDFMYWQSDFSDIDLESITTRSGNPNGSAMVTLHTTGDAQISADNNTNSHLSCGTDTLVTDYKLTFDGNGSSATGGSTVDWTDYSTFLTGAGEGDVTYVADDNDVEVTLYVRAGNYPGQLADAGNYTAIQTLTVHWVGP